jgi:hypothetical protein
MIYLRHTLNGTLPSDLLAAIDDRELMRIVFEAVHETGWPRPLLAEPDVTPEPVLRTVLTYCYARGVFSSAEIETLAKQDPTVRYLCANDHPSFAEIRRFRRRNIPFLRESVARVLHAAWPIANPQREAVSFVVFVAEADHRLTTAIQADSAAMDY